MRKIIIFGTLAALFGLAALAHASDRSRAEMGEGTEVTRVAANDSQDDRHDRDARADYRSHERHGSGIERHEAREDHRDDAAGEHRDRR